MIITLCGSARFESYFKLWNEVLSLAGHSVFSLSVYPSDKAGAEDWYTPEREKAQLDEVHKRKIAASDAILVLNVNAYVGESTIAEIHCATVTGKNIYALESWRRGLGVGFGHTDGVRALSRHFGVQGIEAVNGGSPIDTHHFLSAYNLLHTSPGLVSVSSLVDRIKAHDLQMQTMALTKERLLA